eukprot:6297629-Prymnesium_polylepis.1
MVHRLRLCGAWGVDSAELVHMWDVLKLDKVLAAKRPPGYLPPFAVALAAARCAPATASTLRARLERLHVPGPPISGKALVGIPQLPPHRAPRAAVLHAAVSRAAVLHAAPGALQSKRRQ